MHWDGTITLGNVVSMVVFVLTIIKLHIDNRLRLENIQLKVELMWQTFRMTRVPPDEWKDFDG